MQTQIIDTIQDPDLKVIPEPTRLQKATMGGLIVLGLAALAYFLYWFVDKDHIGYAPLFWVLVFAFGFRILKILHEWYHYGNISVPERPEPVRDWKVDMVTTFVPGEPYEMILETLEAMVNVRYPHKTYLCDEGNDPFLIEKCKELGVIHSYRGPIKKNAKAGNVNFCLENHADGEIAVILDPDHVPSPDFLDRVLPYFQDEEVGFVQCIQAYKNRNESFVAKGAAEQTYHFYGPMMMSMNSYGTVQAIGANCTFRRSALDSIGGHAPGLSEDMHTAMRLHSKGWKSVYVPEALTRGLVPATLSAYYKQQLKWSRGSFDLLVHVVPKLFRNFTWRQVIHYLTIPLYFLSGLIGLIDILVPIIALLTAKSPWHVEMVELLQAALPLLLLNLLIRQYAQRFVLEEHERGFHFMGGALLFGTWWVNLIGLIYTIFNIKVPYIPTPKGDDKIDEWRISVPNIIAIALSIGAIIYGLSVDWSPYSMIMAAYAGINVVMLTFIVLVAQQKSLSQFYHWLYSGKTIISQLRSSWYHFRHGLIYPVLRNTGVGLTLVVGLVLVAFTFLRVERDFDMVREAHFSGNRNQEFYSGLHLDEKRDPISVSDEENQQPSILEKRIDVYPDRWDQTAWEELRTMLRPGQIPMLTIQLVPTADTSFDVIDAYCQGAYTSTWLELAWFLRKWDGPALIRMGVPGKKKNWDFEEGKEVYQDAWQKMVRTVRNAGGWNCLWVWEQADSLQFFPGTEWVDYVSICGDKYPEIEEDSLSLSIVESWGTPILLDQLSLESENLEKWKENKQIHGAIFAPQAPEKLNAVISSVNAYRSEIMGSESYADWNLANRVDENPVIIPASLEENPEARVSLAQNGKDWTFKVDGKPFYVKGISYNPAHDWRDGFTPLTRNKLDDDFAKIREMGGNTIRRYTPGEYDINMFRAAAKADLKVIYGFWFDPNLDYSQNKDALEEYKSLVREKVLRWKGHPSILTWNLGNETYFKLTGAFPPIKRVFVQRAYLDFIDELAGMIHQMDPDHPVMTSLAHFDGLDGELFATRTFVEDIDFLGVNAHYEYQLAEVDTLMRKFLPGRPYLISEFSHSGYWDQEKTDHDGWGNTLEPSPFVKSQNYYRNWVKYIDSRRGENLGGIAYCWQDRLEGTLSWFGITDYEGRKKPAYYALKGAWTGEKVEFPLSDVVLTSPFDLPDEELKFLPFRSVSANNPRKDLEFEWKIIPDGSLSTESYGKVEDAWKLLMVNLPVPDGNYRVYLSIYDREGNVVDASQGFKVPYPLGK